ncbi:hypothetical protein BH11PAT3_BH11PAT3_0440 [soil metagenome]
MSNIIGIDEAGRGPLAGPVAVGAVRIKCDFNKKFFKGIKDSKKLTEKERDKWFHLAVEAKKKNELDFAVTLISEKVIDKKGITAAIKEGMKKCLEKLEARHEDQIFLDGSLYAPKEFMHQETIIKGDEKIPVISLASICAKVTRDVYMKKIAKKYPKYRFENNKGYGTLIHIEAIKKYGTTSVHRQSFLKNIDF